jgi:hypothetical protein
MNPEAEKLNKEIILRFISVNERGKVDEIIMSDWIPPVD